MNEAELEIWSRDFRSRGHSITAQLSAADLIVINTCAVTGEAVRKSRKLMHRLQRDNPRARLVVSGCFASLDPGDAARTLGVDLVVDNRDKDRLVAITEEQLNLHRMPEVARLPEEIDASAVGRQRAFVKVQDGCRYQCSFCVVTLARGEERSRGLGEIIREIHALHARGAKEVVLTGVHLGGYGSDCGSSLHELVGRVLSDTSIPRLRLGAVEPWDLADPFWSLFGDSRLMPHLHLPLQSGADTVLRRMARRCKVTPFKRMLRQARRDIPDFNVTTDIVVGFPGETDDEWDQTLEQVRDIGFGHLHIFAYSNRPGTRAAQMPGQVPRNIIRARSQALHRLGEQMKRATLQRYLGRRMPVLIEGRAAAGRGHWSGYTPNFLRVSVRGAEREDLENSIRTIELDGISAGGDELLGRVSAASL